jgi:rod shape determining protein RodA
MFKFNQFAKFDLIAIVAMIFLIATGLIAIFSLSLESERIGFNNFQKQSIHVLLAILVFLAFSLVDYRIWKSYSGNLYLVALLLLVAVLFLGDNIRGTSGWFKLGFFNVQPAEIMKLALIIALARYFSQIKPGLVSLKHVFISFGYVVVPVFLAAMQPDMGSAVVMIMIWFAMILLSGIEKKYLTGIVLVGFLTIIFGWSFLLKPYQKDRVQSFLNPGSDPLGNGYNVIQSMVAVGSGGIHGKGIGHGSQSKLNFLPEKHTDFIYATIAEERGFVGVGIVIGLFGVLLYRLRMTYRMARDSFGKFVVGGVTMVIFFQAFVNIGMNIGIMPVAGLSLPFLSYGGSFILMTLAFMGLTQSVWIRRIKGETNSGFWE